MGVKAELNCHHLGSLSHLGCPAIDRNCLHASSLEGRFTGVAASSYGSIDLFHSSCYTVWCHVGVGHVVAVACSFGYGIAFVGPVVAERE